MVRFINTIKYVSSTNANINTSLGTFGYCIVTSVVMSVDDVMKLLEILEITRIGDSV